MKKTQLNSKLQTLSLTLFQRCLAEVLKVVFIIFFTKFSGKHLCKSPCIGVPFLIKLTEWSFTFAFGFFSYSFKVAVLKSFAKVIEKICDEIFFSKVYNFTIKGLQPELFSVNCEKFLRSLLEYLREKSCSF